MAIEGTTWRTSSYSGTKSDCVEIARPEIDVLVRDTKDRPGGPITVAPTAWRALLHRLG